MIIEHLKRLAVGLLVGAAILLLWVVIAHVYGWLETHPEVAETFIAGLLIGGGVIAILAIAYEIGSALIGPINPRRTVRFPTDDDE